MNADTTRALLEFLTPQESGNLAITSRFFAAEVKKHLCVVMSEQVGWGSVNPGTTWEEQQKVEGQNPWYGELRFTTTRKATRAVVDELKRDNKIFTIQCGYNRDFAYTVQESWGPVWGQSEKRKSNLWFSKWSI